MIQTTLRALMALLAFALSSQAVLAQTSNNEAEQKAAFEAASKVHIAGPATVPVRDQAALKLPEGYLFVPTPEAGRLLKSMGNTIGNDLAGVVFPANNETWFAVIRYVNEGHIKDDDAKEWNADELLSSLKEGTEAANAERAKLGIKPMEVIGWTEKPRYEATSHRLVWSASTRDKGTTGTTGLGVNYNTYSLGREGYVSLNLVTELDLLEKHKPAALELLGALQFNEGRRYADFNSSTDKVAAYGLAALVAGAAAKKLGLFALILAFVAKFAKVFVVAGGAALWGAFKLFGKKKAAQPSPVEVTADASAGKPPGAT
jgi:uncharacterized membrane-anchored protein